MTDDTDHPVTVHFHRMADFDAITASRTVTRRETRGRFIRIWINFSTVMASSMDTFVECLACGFVTYSESSEEPEPRGRGDCPDCGLTEFTFTE